MGKVWIVELQIASIRGGFHLAWAFAAKEDAERWARDILTAELANDELPPIGPDESLEDASDRWETFQREELCNEDEDAGYCIVRELDVLPVGTVLDLKKERG